MVGGSPYVRQEGWRTQGMSLEGQRAVSSGQNTEC